MPFTIAPNLLPYLPPSYLDSQGNLTVSVQQATTVASDIETRADSLPPAAQRLFLDMVDDDSAQLAPSGGEPPADLDSVLSSLENSAQSTTFASFMALGVNPAALAEVIIQLSNNEETQALQNQVDNLQQAETDLEAQASEDHTAASTLRSGAVMALAMACVSAAISIVSAGVSIGGAGAALKGLSHLSEFARDAPDDEFEDVDDVDDDVGGIDDSDSVWLDGESDDTDNVELDSDPDENRVELDDPDDYGEVAEETNDADAGQNTTLTRAERLQEIQTAMGRVQGISQGLSGLATLATGVGTYFNSVAQANSQDDTADGQTDAAMATQAQAQAAFAQNIVQSAQSLQSSLIQYVQDLLSSTSEKMQAITRG